VTGKISPSARAKASRSRRRTFPVISDWYTQELTWPDSS
jgi:hypothetical protein